mgnify:CR=1 FL=1
MCGGFVSNEGDEVGNDEMIYKKFGKAYDGFHFPIPAAPAQKLTIGASYITIGSAILLAAISNAL